jgi:hypothetical protein
VFTSRNSLLKCALISFALLSGCKKITIKNTRECIVAGVIQAGMDCATTNTSEISAMDFEEAIEFLEPQGERADPANPGKRLPARAGAVCRSDEDFTAQKTALESACALLRSRCTPEMKNAIGGMNRVSSLLEQEKEKKKNPL